MKNRPERRRYPKLSIFAVAVIVAILSVVGVVVLARNYYQHNLQAVSSEQSTKTVTIKPGSSVNQIADTLKQAGLIRNTGVFKQYVRSKNIQNKLQAGTYSLSPSQDVPEIATILSHGNIVKNLFTILPGQRLDQIKSAMINAGFNEAEVEAAFNPELYASLPALSDKPAGANLEGYLYPNSYQRIASTTPQTIITQSLEQMRLNLTSDLRDSFVTQGLTLHKAIIVASMVEQEVSKPAERAQVAQVLLSRLRQNMPLQSDPVVKYGDILASHPFSLSFDTPYNVYLHAGLPPSPISNVSASSLEAVAHPANTDWLYFVAGDNGKTYFSKTLAEHEALTAQYCKKLCQ